MALVFKDVNLDLSKVPEKDKDIVKNKVANLIYDEVLRYVAKGKSPVAGEGAFKTLNARYAKKEKQGNKTPNLQLEGDLIREDFDTLVMLNEDTVRVGHFKENTKDTEGEKADGHNQHSVKAKLWAAAKGFPKRRYVPSDAQSFDFAIMDKVQNVIGKYEVSGIDLSSDALNSILNDTGKVTVIKETPEITSIRLDDFLSDEALEELIGNRLNP